MLKPLLQFGVIAASFFLIWFGLDRIDWMTIFQVEKTTKNIEEKLGDLYWDILKKIDDEITDKNVISPVDSLITRICDRNDINRDKIKLHVVENGEVNAFALPDYHLVVFSGLIEECENEAELCGIIAHELAHLEKGHIMQKLVKEVGLSVLLSMTSGNGNPEIIRQAVKVLTSSAYDRKLETEADLAGADYMIRAGIDPEAFAQFMFRMSENEKGLPDQLFWISTHPGSEQRTRAILDYIKDREFTEEIVLDSLQWISLKENSANH
ncbi:MAG: M48 family metallopeptidase [Saprospiraceae bacterium]|nr:M48 family metallopeptidase [Saprospiraceae bacterium]